MERKIAYHIEKLIKELEIGLNTEQILKSFSYTLPQDVTLLHIYLQLGYCLQSNTFRSSPSSEQALSLLSQEYLLPFKQANVDCFISETPSKVSDPDSGVREEFLDSFYSCDAHLLCQEVEEEQVAFTPNPKKMNRTPSTHYFTPSSVNSDIEDTPRSTRGLRHLAFLVKQLVHKPTSFKDVAVNLIDELIQSEGNDRVREERNVRRRVYDAINVLIAAGVLERKGRNVCWREYTLETHDRNSELVDKKERLREKQKEFKGLLNKYLAIRHLLNLNSNDRRRKPALKMPFLFVSTEDSPLNSVSIRYTTKGNALHLSCAKQVQVFGDMDILLALNMHKMNSQQLRMHLPSQDLLKYCNGT